MNECLIILFPLGLVIVFLIIGLVTWLVNLGSKLTILKSDIDFLNTQNNTTREMLYNTNKKLGLLLSQQRKKFRWRESGWELVDD